MPIPAGDLVQNQIVISVKLYTTLAEALNLMIEHDFSQLPIIDIKNRPLGVVTSASIARALLRFGVRAEELNVSDAILKIPTYQADEDLLYILDNMLMHSAVFIVNAAGALLGIITEYDTTQYFRQRAEDIVLLNDIENTLKEHILNAYGASENESAELREAINGLSSSWNGIRKKGELMLKAYSKSKQITTVKTEIDEHIDKYFPLKEELKMFHDLTLSEFIQLSQKAWVKLNDAFKISGPAWTKMIEEVREIRNKLVHFRGDISPVERHNLRFCADWFKAHQLNPLEEESTVDNSPAENGMNGEATEVAPVQNVVPRKEDVERAIKNKYLLLTNYLKNLDVQGKRGNVNLTFAYIQEIIKGKLPTAAFAHANWWTDVSTHSQQWLETGWKVRGVQFGGNNPHASFTFWPLIDTEIKEPWQFVYWANHLDCTNQELQDAINKVGEESDLVEIHVKLEKGKQEE
ncbi:CBS domain-containing protein [Hymenobacter sp. M29]|uniref:CBS domain-containing protein n=1 Tax=Hymenobacter mellowenesis TaxID=3063995 RepID=A0ABT9A6U7_9BACT|nr:CBS domain-containing protein [Hymenobacter sp. M29]MDO7845566.1 CBS domain-containing protein [Hymenobacter sp. M29]